MTNKYTVSIYQHYNDRMNAALELVRKHGTHHDSYMMNELIAIAEGKHCPTCGERDDLTSEHAFDDVGQHSKHYVCALCATDWTMHECIDGIERSALNVEINYPGRSAET